MGPTPVSRYNVFSFFFFSVPNSPKLILFFFLKKKLNGQPRKRKEKKKKKKKTQTANANPGKEKEKEKKKVKRWSKVAAVGPLCVFNYNIAIDLWVMETENSQKLFSVSITHNSKIRELSDGNRVIVCQTNFLLWVPPFLSYELWKQRIELSKLAIQTGYYYPLSSFTLEKYTRNN